MTTATQFALIESRIKADHSTERAIRRQRFDAAEGTQPGELIIEIAPDDVDTFSGIYARVADNRRSSSAGYAFGRSNGQAIRAAYRELKILHD